MLKFVIDTLFKPVTFLLPSTIIALLSVTVPSLTLFNLFNSAALDLTNNPFNLRPPSTPSWDAMLRTWLPDSSPILTTPFELCVTTLSFCDCPNVILSKAAVSPVTAVAPIVNLAPTVKSCVTVWLPFTVKSPLETSTLPCELITNFSVAVPLEPVENTNLVALLVEVNSPSEIALIEAATVIASTPDDSSGA